MNQKKMNLLQTLKERYLNSGSERGKGIKKNITGMFGLKAVDVGISYLRFPLTLKFLGTELHGVWLTVGGIMNWFSFFNIGLGTGLRNKLAEALAEKDFTLARIYVSSTYTIISIISSIMFVLLMISVFTLNWPEIVAVPESYNEMLVTTLLIVFTFFAMRFVLQLVGTVLVADQKPALSQLLNTASSVIFFVGVWFALKYRVLFGNLVVIGALSSGSVLLVQIVATIILFSKKYKYIRPSVKYIDWHKFKSLASVGVQFFIVQISVIIMFSTDNIIISQITGPADVVPYNVARKYFGIVEMLFLIVLEPFWSAFTQAYVKDEINWIKKSIRKLLMIWGLSLGGSVIMLALSGWVYDIWIGDMIIVPFHLSLLMMFFFMIKSWNNVFVYLINGVGKIRLQLYMSIVIAVINIPMSIFFAKNLEMGSAGVILGTIVCLSFGAVLHPIQYKRIINKTARGIWNQ
jgi:O-antigen/teichoic acid export membrane protein